MYCKNNKETVDNDSFYFSNTKNDDGENIKFFNRTKEK